MFINLLKYCRLLHGFAGHERVDEANRLQKTLEGANIKLAAVASDVLGVSGRAMLAAVLDGERDPDVLAELARGVLRAKLPQLRQALNGRVQPHHLVLISQLLAHIDFLEQAIAQVQVEIERCMPSFEEALELLQTIPGIRAVAAAAILAEIGADMSRFPTARHLVSWAGLCPSNKESAGKRMKGPANRGNVWLRGIMGEVAWATVKKRATYFYAQFNRVARRRGRNKAAVAVAHSLLVVIYHVLKTGKPYVELGVDYFDQLDATRIERHHVRRLEQLGYNVTLSPLDPPWSGWSQEPSWSGRVSSQGWRRRSCAAPAPSYSTSSRHCPRCGHGTPRATWPGSPKEPSRPASPASARSATRLDALGAGPAGRSSRRGAAPRARYLGCSRSSRAIDWLPPGSAASSFRNHWDRAA